MASELLTSTQVRSLDETDLDILRVLQQDASLSYKELAAKCQMRTSTLFDRVKRLRAEGVIKATIPLIDSVRLGHDTTAWVRLKVQDTGACCTIASELAKREDVLEVHEIAGEYDILVKAKVANNEALHDLTKQINRIPGVKDSASLLALKTIKEDPRVPVPRTLEKVR